MSRIAALGFLVTVVAAWPAQADTVLLKNGDQLTGKVVSLADGKLKFATAMAGEVTIDVANIQTFATDEPVELHLKDKTVLDKKIHGAEAGRFGVESAEVVEPHSFAISDIEKINPPKAKWTGSFSISATMNRGNADTQDFNISINAVRRSEIDRITFDAAYDAGRQKVETDTGDEDWRTTERSVWGALQYDYFLSKKAYGWGRTRAEKDSIAQLDLRLTAGAGAGYQWHEDAVWGFTTEAGLAWVSEQFSNETEDQDAISSRVAYRYKRLLFDGLTFDHDAEWYRSFEDPDDNYVTTRASLRSTLTKSLFAEFKVKLDWDSTPAQGSERTDVMYGVGVGWSF
ncbi:MAG: DUF481 domain-containing protein [Planctomycetota bacterium]